MKKIVAVLLALVAAVGLCFGVAGCKNGSSEKIKGQNVIGCDIVKVTFSTSFFSSYYGILEDKEEIDCILTFFNDIDFVKTEKSDADKFENDCAGVTVDTDEKIIYITIYKNGRSHIKRVNKTHDAAEYFVSAENSVAYENLIKVMEEERLRD